MQRAKHNSHKIEKLPRKIQEMLSILSNLKGFYGPRKNLLGQRRTFSAILAKQDKVMKSVLELQENLNNM